MMTRTPSPTEGLTEFEVQRFRCVDTRFWLEYDRHRDNLPGLVTCDGCSEGIAQYECEDETSLVAVNGSSQEPGEPHIFYCPACTASK